MAAPTIARVRKRVSKNKKKSWRKHVNIEDVEEHLADERLQLRTGGLVAEKADDELFFVDTGIASSKGAEKQGPGRIRGKELKCHAALEMDSKIKPVKLPRAQITRHPVVRPERDATAKKRKLALVKELQQTRQRRKLKRMPVAKALVATYNLWSDGSKDAQPSSAAVQPDEHYLAVTKKLPVKPPAHFHEKPSAVPAVEVAHPGASYNPAYEDHQVLLNAAEEVELTKLKKEQRLERQLEGKFPDVHNAPTQASWLHEMSAGLFDEEDAENECEGSADDRLSLNPPVVRDSKKTLKKRKTEEELVLRELSAKVDAEAKRRDKDVFRLKTMKAEIKAEEARKLVRTAERRQKAVAAESLGTRKLGSKAYEKPAPEVNLTEELTGSLRLLKPDGNLLEDRFKSLQKRNIIEPRTRAKRVLKYKRKEFEKRSHRDM